MKHASESESWRYIYVCVLRRCRMRNVFCGSICEWDRGGSLDLVITVGRWFLIRVEIESVD